MNELRYPYNMVRDNLRAALAKARDVPYKDAPEWQLIKTLEKAENLLDQEYFGYPIVGQSE